LTPSIGGLIRKFAAALKALGAIYEAERCIKGWQEQLDRARAEFERIRNSQDEEWE